MNYFRKNLKSLNYFFYNSLILSLLFSCDSPEDIAPVIVDPVAFQWHPNLVWNRADVGNLEKIGDRLYYSNNYNPGYFDLSGTQHQFAGSSFDMRFSHAFSEKLTVGVLSNRNTLIVVPNFVYASSYVASISPMNIPDLPIDAQLVEGWFGNSNFAFNENYLISTWDRNFSFPDMEPIENTFILELNLINSGYGPYVNPQNPVLKKISLDLVIDGFKRFDIFNAFPFKNGWIVSGGIAGVQNSFYVTKNGEATPLRDFEERFIIISMIQNQLGELLLTTENKLFYSANGDIFNLTELATSNQFLRINYLDNRLITWAGRDNVYEILNYKDPENIEIKELVNLGLEGLWVRDVELFNDKVYVATNGGLFLKNAADFWQIKGDPTNEGSSQIGWIPSH